MNNESISVGSMHLINRHNLLRNAHVQRAIVVAVIVVVFWNGLWAGVPRADQVPYLHQISRFTDYWDILINSPSWNRTQSAGDYVLYRPVLYWLLGTFYYLFRYDFVLWQASALFLHILVVLGVHSILMQGHLRNTICPILISLFFGTALLSAELILWNHIVGYVLFCVLVTFSIYFLIKYFEGNKFRFAIMSVLLGLMAEFTYEFGVIINFIIGLGFLYAFIVKRYASVRKKEKMQFLQLALLFLGCVFIYPAASLLDLWARNIQTVVPANFADQDVLLDTLTRAFAYTLQQILFWIGGWFLPTVYKIEAGGRAVFSGFDINSFFSFFNVAVLAIVALKLFRKRASLQMNSYLHARNAMLVLFGVLLCLFLYSLMIAYGRAVPRGIVYVVRQNVYYSYVAYLILVIGIGVYSWMYQYEKKSIAQRQTSLNVTTKNQSFGFGKINVSLWFMALIVLNAVCTYQLILKFNEYASPRQVLVDNVLRWIQTTGKLPHHYFTISRDCTGNDALAWFDQGHIRKGSNWSPPVTLADALWPDKSFKLNKPLLPDNSPYIVSKITCDGHRH